MGTRPVHPDTIRTMLRDLRQRIDALARTPSVGNTVIRPPGALILTDATGAARIVLGTYTWPTTGQVLNGVIVVLDTSGNPRAVLGNQPTGAASTGTLGPEIASY